MKGYPGATTKMYMSETGKRSFLLYGKLTATGLEKKKLNSGLSFGQGSSHILLPKGCFLFVLVNDFVRR